MEYLYTQHPEVFSNKVYSVKEARDNNVCFPFSLILDQACKWLPVERIDKKGWHEGVLWL